MDKESFKDSNMYKAVSMNNVKEFLKLADDIKQERVFKRLSTSGETYLHVAIQNNCDIRVIKGLIDKVRLGQRNVDCKTALELALERQNEYSVIIAQAHQEYILHCIRDGKVKEVEELVTDGWTYWPVKGMPEFETFAEAPMYLSQSILDVMFSEATYIVTKKQLRDSVGALMEDKSLVSVRDPLGLSFLHKAVLFRDSLAVTHLLTHEDAATMLAMQDNMGRNVLHYSSCFNEHTEVRALLEDKVTSLSLDSLLVTVDKKGFSPMDYAQRRAKIDAKKVLNLAIAIGKVEGLGNLFNDVVLSRTDTDVDDDVEVIYLLKNCAGTALLDVTGRNILHKLIIFGNSEEALSKIRQVLDIDNENLLYKSPDLWGRTPLHYAHMLNHTMAIEALTTVRGSVTKAVINEVKQVRDHDGKTVDEFHPNESDAKALAVNLQKTMKLLYQVRPMMQAQQLFWKALFVEADKTELYNEDSHEQDDGHEIENNDAEEILESLLECIEKICNIREDRGEHGARLLFSMKDPFGSTLAHYAVRLDLEELQNILMDTFGSAKCMMNIYDNFGRTPFHFIAALPEDSEFKEWLTAGLEDDAVNDTENSNDENNEINQGDPMVIKKKQRNKTDCKEKVVSVDLRGKTLHDYDSTSDDMTEGEFLQFSRARFEKLGVGTHVKRSGLTGGSTVVQIQVAKLPTDNTGARLELNENEKVMTPPATFKSPQKFVGEDPVVQMEINEYETMNKTPLTSANSSCCVIF